MALDILLHICCGPCTIYPLRKLREEGHEVRGYFYNPNIHPYLEYKKRLDTLDIYAGREGLRVIREEGYPLEGFMRQIVFREEDRCRHCYRLRLVKTAKTAKAGHCDAFTTTLLYSRYQKHDLIRSIGEDVARECDIPFLYRDFREGWSEGVKISKALGLYRQPYCGCIYSEKDRYCISPGNEEGGDRLHV
jgi:predicted adenine nucleotide alpha hydrolase (AANH) superfamily ATPase